MTDFRINDEIIGCQMGEGTMAYDIVALVCVLCRM